MSTGYLPGPGGFQGALLAAFFASLIMNVTFGPMMMGTHRVSDTFVDRKVDRLPGGVTAAIEAVEMTADLGRRAHPAPARALNSWEYIDAVAARL